MYQPDFSRDVVCLLGVAFDRVSLADAQVKVYRAIDGNRRCHIATPNVNLMRIAHADPAFRNQLLASDLSLIDGTPLVWMARLIGLGITTRAAGSDLFEALGQNRSRTMRTFFFGGTEDVCATLRRRLSGRIGGVRCVGAFAPGFGSVTEMSNPATVARINEARPEIVLVAISARKGLDWIERNEAELTAPVLANLGATIHFAAGTISRAPERWRGLGLEWLWRIRQEPQLWRRYAADFGLLARAMLLNAGPAVVISRLRMNTVRPAPLIQIAPGSQGHGKVLTLQGHFGGDRLDGLRQALAAATRTPGPLRIDISGVQHLDAAALGLVLLAYGHQSRVRQPFAMTGVNWRMRLLLRIHGCGFLVGASAAKGREKPMRDSAKDPARDPAGDSTRDLAGLSAPHGVMR